MVEEILRSSTEEFEQRKLNYTQCDVGEIVDEVRATFDLKYQAREVRWNIDIPHSTEIVADRLHIAAALSALVDNAIKYCFKQPYITITASSNNTNTTISISDNGTGIPMSERKRIFEKFYRISQGNRHDTKGFGLGLYYAKNIIELHNGKISLRSTVGKGSTFEITLPTYDKTTNTNS
jgi:signal transduction histidine kinase